MRTQSASKVTSAGVLASGAGPVGTVRRFGPRRGWHPDTTTIGLGGAATAIAVLAIGGATAWRAGARSRTEAASGRRQRWRLAPRHRGWALAGTTFALSSARARRHRAARLSVVGAVLGGIVAIRIALSFSLEVEIDGVWPWAKWRVADAPPQDSQGE